MIASNDSLFFLFIKRFKYEIAFQTQFFYNKLFYTLFFFDQIRKIGRNSRKILLISNVMIIIFLIYYPISTILMSLYRKFNSKYIQYL